MTLTTNFGRFRVCLGGVSSKKLFSCIWTAVTQLTSELLQIFLFSGGYLENILWRRAVFDKYYLWSIFDRRLVFSSRNICMQTKSLPWRTLLIAINTLQELYFSSIHFQASGIYLPEIYSSLPYPILFSRGNIRYSRI